jgi:hypothetical protein
MEDFYWEEYVVIEGLHLWLLHTLAWSSYYIWSIFFKGAFRETLLIIYGGVYFTMLHGYPSPLKKPKYPVFPRTGDFKTPKKRFQLVGDVNGDLGAFKPSPIRPWVKSGTDRVPYRRP